MSAHKTTQDQLHELFFGEADRALRARKLDAEHRVMRSQSEQRVQ